MIHLPMPFHSRLHRILRMLRLTRVKAHPKPQNTLLSGLLGHSPDSKVQKGRVHCPMSKDKNRLRICTLVESSFPEGKYF